MLNLINIYDDNQSALIVDETSTNVVDVQQFKTLGESPFNLNVNSTLVEKNMNFIEMYVFDESGNRLVTINSARPLLRRPSTQKFYFGEYHVHNQTYMVGKKHTNIPHETLEVVKINQILPYPLEARNNQMNVTTDKKFAIKMSDIFYILKNIENFTLEKNSKFKIQYGIFEDVFLRVTQIIQGNLETIEQDQVGGGA